MKTVVFDRNVFELEVKPHEMLGKYKELLAREVRDRLAVSKKLTTCSCPGCRSGHNSVAFEKYGMKYLLCDDCGSLFVSPRPSEEMLDDFFQNSKSSCFWRENILSETRETRRSKLFRPRAQWLLDAFDAYRPNAQLGIVAGHHNDLLIQELCFLEKNLFRLIVTNPVADIEFADITMSGLTIKPTRINDLPSLGPADVFLAFDIMDRCADPDALFASARATLSPGGLFLGSTTLISGFDLQVLWDRSETIYPPERLNLFSLEGMLELFNRHGFEALEFSTPGMFDVEIVKRALRSNPDDDWPRFVRYLVENRDDDALQTFQEYLQKYCLSSFGRIVLRRSD